MVKNKRTKIKKNIALLQVKWSVHKLGYLPLAYMYVYTVLLVFVYFCYKHVNMLCSRVFRINELKNYRLLSSLTTYLSVLENNIPLSFPLSWLNTRLLTKVTRWMLLCEQELPTHPEHMTSSTFDSRVFCLPSFVFLSFSYTTSLLWSDRDLASDNKLAL